MSSSFVAMTMRQRLRRYCQWTSLHGFNFLVYRERSVARTIFWVTIILISSIGALFVVGINTSDFASSTVSYDLDTPTHPLDDVVFPSLVLCNMNHMRSSFIWALINDPLLKNTTFPKMHQLLEKVFVKGQNLELSPKDEDLITRVMQSKAYDDFFEELLKVGTGQTINQTVSNVPIYHHHRLSYRSMNLTGAEREQEKRAFFLTMASQFRYGELLTRIDFSGYGALVDLSFTSDISETCLWITPLVLQPKTIDFREFLPYARNGINNGLRLLLDAETFDYASPISSKSGFVFTVIHHLDIAILKQTGSVAMPGQALQVAITPTLTSSADSIRHRFDPERRQCYFEDEVQFNNLPAFGFRYGMSNCLYEASLQAIEHKCKCIAPITLAFPDKKSDLPTCEGPGKLCMAKIMDDIGAERHIDVNGEKMKCLAPCYDQTHQFLVTSSAYPNRQSFHFGEDFCLILEKLRKSCGNEKRNALDLTYPKLCQLLDQTGSMSCKKIRGIDFDDTSLNSTEENELTTLRKEVALYASENLVALDVYIGEPYVRLYMRREKITVISFIGNVGGLLGLFMGFSFISVVEVFYILCFGTSKIDNEKWADSNREDVILGRKGRQFGNENDVEPFARTNRSDYGKEKF